MGPPNVRPKLWFVNGGSVPFASDRSWWGGAFSAEPWKSVLDLALQAILTSAASTELEVAVVVVAPSALLILVSALVQSGERGSACFTEAALSVAASTTIVLELAAVERVATIVELAAIHASRLAGERDGVSQRL